MSRPPTQVPADMRLNDREQIQYLLGNPPSWMMRYGISVVAGFFVLMMFLSFYIRYPDVIDVRITLTTTNPPIRVMAWRTGRISDLLVADNEAVEQGALLAVIENPALWQDVLRLDHWIQGNPKLQDTLPGNLKLGDLQSLWSTFCQNKSDYHYFTTNGNTDIRIASLQGRIQQLDKINANLQRQKVILNEEFTLMTKVRNRQLQLLSQQIIAETEAEKTEVSWLQHKRQIEAADATILQNQMQIKQLQSQIEELRLSKSDNEITKSFTLSEDLQRLRSALEAWKQNYLILAPVAGMVSLNKIRSAQQSVAAGEEILAIVQYEGEVAKNHIIGRATVASTGIGKVNPGIHAIVRLDAYPAQQYGTLKGTITNISALPQKEGYTVDISLPDSLITSYGQTIPFRQEMSGQVQIITVEHRVIERIFDRLSDLLKNK